MMMEITNRFTYDIWAMSETKRPEYPKGNRLAISGYGDLRTLLHFACCSISDWTRSKTALLLKLSLETGDRRAPIRFVSSRHDGKVIAHAIEQAVVFGKYFSRQVGPRAA